MWTGQKETNDGVHFKGVRAYLMYTELRELAKELGTRDMKTKDSVSTTRTLGCCVL